MFSSTTLFYLDLLYYNHIRTSQSIKYTSNMRRSMFYMQDTMTGEQDQFLMKSNMDGSEEDILLADESFLYPVSLAVDIHTETLYLWEKIEQKLHSCKFDGSSRQVRKSES